MPNTAAETTETTESPRTVLVCTDCEDAWEPGLSDPDGHTGCRRCGGWTWIGQITEPDPTRRTTR